MRHHLWEVDEEAVRAAAAGEIPSRVRHWSDARGSASHPRPPFLSTSEEPFEVVIGSDLLYFSNQEKPLLAAIAHRLSRRCLPDGSPAAVALICQTMRRNNRTVWQRFVSAAEETGFHVVDDACGGGCAEGFDGAGGGKRIEDDGGGGGDARNTGDAAGNAAGDDVGDAVGGVVGGVVRDRGALTAEGEAEASETLETAHAEGYRMLTLTWLPELLVEE